MTKTSEAATKDRLVCAGCHRELECCSFCGEDEGCPEPSCYPCMAVAIGQSSKRLHPHGG
jgi:hypothetical protein